MTDIPDDAQHYIECGTENCERYGELYCNCCYRQLCKQCRDDHLDSPDNEGHDVVPYLSRNRKLPEEKCKRHPTKNLELLCQNCQIPLCSKCVTQETHKGHKFDDLEKFYSTNYSSCQEKLPIIENNFLPTSKELRSEIQDDAKEIKKIMGNIRAQVKTDAASLKYLVDEVMSETLEGVDRFEEKLLKEITLQDKTIEEHIAYLLELKGEFQAYQSATKITDVIIEHSKRLEIRPIPETTKPVTPTYTAGQYSKEDISNLLGKLHADQTEPKIRDIKTLASSNKLKRRHLEASKVKELTISGVECVFHISLDKSEKVWASDNSGNLVQADLQGIMLQKIDARGLDGGYHTVTQNDDLLYADRDNKVIMKKPMDQEISHFIRTVDWEPISICSSHKTGEIFVGMKKTTGSSDSDAKVVKYSMYGGYQYNIHRDKNLFSEPRYISENINGDICTSDSGKKEVVVVTEARQLKFSYKGQKPSFYPYGICTDKVGHIMVCDGYFENGTVDIIDKDGQFLAHLVIQPEKNRPYSLCVDDQDNLYVGHCSSNTLNVYKYLQ